MLHPILNRLDYCNSLLVGTTSEYMSRIQVVQNSAANLKLKWKRRDHATHTKKIHWAFHGINPIGTIQSALGQYSYKVKTKKSLQF